MSAGEVNKKVDRSAAERLQEKLYIAAEAALDKAIADGNIPSSLLSATQSILKDAGLTPDLSVDEDPEVGTHVVTPNWLKDMQRDLGL